MKTLIALVCLVGLAAAIPKMSYKERVKIQMRLWGAVLVHCKEETTSDEEYKKCRDCFMGVGDWATKEGGERGFACAQTYMAGEVQQCNEIFMKELENPDNDQIVYEANVCWEKALDTKRAENCWAETEDGDEKMVNAVLCMAEHARKTHKFAEVEIKGYDPESIFRSFEEDAQDDTEEGKPSRMRKVMSELFSEAECAHANEGNEERIRECVVCVTEAMKGSPFAHPRHIAQIDLRHHSQEKYGKATVCSALYLAPIYTECTTQLVDLVKIWDPADEEIRMQGMQIRMCYMRKLAKHFLKDCVTDETSQDAAGLQTVADCAKMKVMDWIGARRPGAIDLAALFMKGRMEEDDEGGVATSAV